jgi:hypothetical protein
MNDLRRVVTCLFAVTFFGAVNASIRSAQADVYGTDCPPGEAWTLNPLPSCSATNKTSYALCKTSPSGKCCSYTKTKLWCTATGELLEWNIKLLAAGGTGTCTPSPNNDGSSICAVPPGGGGGS